MLFSARNDDEQANIKAGITRWLKKDDDDVRRATPSTKRAGIPDTLSPRSKTHDHEKFEKLVRDLHQWLNQAYKIRRLYSRHYTPKDGFRQGLSLSTTGNENTNMIQKHQPGGVGGGCKKGNAQMKGDLKGVANRIVSTQALKGDKRCIKRQTTSNHAPAQYVWSGVVTTATAQKMVTQHYHDNALKPELDAWEAYDARFLGRTEAGMRVWLIRSKDPPRQDATTPKLFAETPWRCHVAYEEDGWLKCNDYNCLTRRLWRCPCRHLLRLTKGIMSLADTTLFYHNLTYVNLKR